MLKYDMREKEVIAILVSALVIGIFMYVSREIDRGIEEKLDAAWVEYKK